MSHAALPPSGAVSVHIDRIVLDGFAFGPRERAQLEAALQERLGELLAQAAPAATLAGARPALRTADVGMAHPRDASGLGQAVAQSLHGGLVR